MIWAWIAAGVTIWAVICFLIVYWNYCLFRPVREAREHQLCWGCQRHFLVVGCPKHDPVRRRRNAAEAAQTTSSAESSVG